MLARAERMDALLELVRIQRLQRRQVAAKFAVEWGLTIEKVQEYIRLLMEAGQVEISRKDGCMQLVDRRVPTSMAAGSRCRKSRKSLKGKSC